LRFLNRVPWWLTKFWIPVGRRVVIIGGGKHGCELAEFLVKRGREVTIVDTAETLGEGLFHHLKCALFAWFEKKGVTMIAGARYIEITGKGLTILTREGNRQTLEADSILPAISLRPVASCLRSLEGKDWKLRSEIAGTRWIVDAIAEARV
jgi:2,4-dienoyl-CoA reductase (NADPH2)